MANTKLPSRLLDTSAIPALNVTGDLTVDTTTLKVDSTNNRVGIGTTSPNGTLNISNNGAEGFEFGPGVTNFGVANTNYIASYDRSANVYRDISFDVGGVEGNAIRFQTGGNVGIGTASPDTKLQVSGDISTAVDGNAYQLYYTQARDFITNSGATAIIKQIDNDATNAKIDFKSWTNSTLMTIMNSGNIGIGTTNPLGKFVVSNGGAEGFEVFPGSASGQNSFQHYNRSGSAYLRNRNIASEFTFNLSGATDDAVTFKAGGNVGIGTDTPANPLSISVQAHGLYSQHRPSSGVGVGQEMYYKFNTADGTPEIFSSIYSEIESNANGAESGKIALRAAKAGSLETGLILIGSTGNVGIGVSLPTANFQINGSTDAGGGSQNMLIKNLTTASYSSTNFVGTGRVLDFFTNSNNNQDFSAIRFTNPGGSRETAIAVVADQVTTQDGTPQGDVVIQGYDGDGYIETQRFRANGASSSTGQRRTGSYTSFAYINHTYTFDHAGYSGAGTPANSNDHWLEVPLYSNYSSSAGGGWVEIDICWHATHAQAAHLHSYKLVWGSSHGRILNVSVISSSANATAGSYNPYAFTSSSQLFRHPTAGDAYMTKMYIEIKGSTNHSGARTITLRGVGHPSVKNIAPVIDHGSDSTPDGITPTTVTSAITATG